MTAPIAQVAMRDRQAGDVLRDPATGDERDLWRELAAIGATVINPHDEVIIDRIADAQRIWGEHVIGLARAFLESVRWLIE